MRFIQGGMASSKDGGSRDQSSRPTPSPWVTLTAAVTHTGHCCYCPPPPSHTQVQAALEEKLPGLEAAAAQLKEQHAGVNGCGFRL